MLSETEETSESDEQDSKLVCGPLTFSNEVKEHFHCGDLTSENATMYLPTETVVEDIKNKAEESSFFKYKDYVEDYPEDSMLLVLDTDSKYGEEYYLCLTVEAKQAVLAEFSEATETETEPEEVKPKIEIVEETIEEQIKGECEDDTREKIQIIVLPNTKAERKPLELSHRLPTDYKELYVEILPDSEFYEESSEEEESLQPIYRKTADKGIQVSVAYTMGFSQTARFKVGNACSQTEWKLFTDEEKDAICKTEDLCFFFKETEKRLLDVLIENASGGLEKPWASLKDKESELDTGTDVHLTIDRSFTCVGEKEAKMITSVDWHPVYNDVFLVSTAQNCSFEEQVDHLSDLLLAQSFLHIWSIKDQLLPRLLLYGCDEVLTAKFNKTMPHLVAGGCVNGQLVLWDLTKHEAELEHPVKYDWTRHTTPYNVRALGDDTSLPKSPVVKYCASSNIDQSHILGLHHLEWLPAHVEVQPKGEVKAIHSSQSFQLVSCGSDGCLRFWDIHPILETQGAQKATVSYVYSPYEVLDMIWKPFHLVDVSGSEGMKYTSLTVFSLKISQSKTKSGATKSEASTETEEKELSTIFYAGSEDGKVLQGDFNLSKILGGKPGVPNQPKFYTSVHGIPIHGGAVIEIAHSPFLDGVFFSLGEKAMAIWKEDLLRGPLFLDVSQMCNITAGHWSPTRPAVFTLGLQDGSLRVWDLLKSSRSPQLVQMVASSSITTITTRWISDDKQVLAIGDGDGFVHVLNLPKYLWKPVENEILVVQQFLEKEAKRVKFQAKKQAEIDRKKVAEARRLEEERKKEKEKAAAATAEPTTAPEVKPETLEVKTQASEDIIEYVEFSKMEERYLRNLGYLVCEEVKKELLDDDDS